MKRNILAIADELSDQDLHARLCLLAGREREDSMELVAHLAILDRRPAVYASQGYGSLFAYCTQALRLSEDAACNRIEAARACRRFPVILDLLAAGEVTVTSIRLLGRHLTPENHRTVLAKASGRSRRQVPSVPSEPTPANAPPSPRALPPTPRPIVRATAPERYRVQFTIGPETHERLRRLQALLRREIPDGDPAVIFDRAIILLLEKVEKAKLGATVRPRPIRPETDSSVRKPAPRSRDVPRAVKRAAWRRDAGQCAFVSASGRRCSERAFLEFHHVQAYAKQGPATVENISVHRWRHNQYEAELIFGPHRQNANEKRNGGDG
jgi:hypothetical protein